MVYDIIDGMKRALIITMAVAAAALRAAHADPAAYDAGKDLAASQDNWEQSADDFAVEHGKHSFRFADNRKRDVVVCREQGAVTFFGIPVMETRIYFKNKTMNGIEFSIYNKGDAVKHGGTMTMAELEKTVEEVSARLSAGGKVPQTVRVRVKNDRAKMGHKSSRSWPRRTPFAELSWGVSGERGAETVEFVRLSLGGVPQGEAVRGKAPPAAGQAAAGLTANVKRNDEGDVYIGNVPMVDQGDKGYCSVAAAERVLRYFGQSIDEHELAQIAGTSAEGGTSTKAMISAVETIGRKCRLGKREISSKIASWADGEKRLKEYNKNAKRLKRPELDIGDYITQSGNSRIFDIGGMERAMEPKVLKAMSMKDKSGYGRFVKGVREQTARGVPLFWSVMLGVYPEPGIPQKAGGHMRLIIGYNAERGEIIYSDSWGAGHEIKHMPDDWAWTITHNLFYLNPR